MDIQIINVDPTTRVVTFKVQPRVLTGIMKLVQIVVLSILNVAGQSVLYPNDGGNLPALLGSNVDPNDSNAVFAEVARLIKKSETETINYQVGVNDPAEELLSELQITQVGSVDIDRVAISIRIVNQAGQSFDIAL